jgi:hypothetical protein
MFISSCGYSADIHKNDECWFYLYRWTDYNYYGGFGTGMLIIKPNMIFDDEKKKETIRLEESFPKERRVRVSMTKFSKISCKV